jgi:deferrochelatase/peroxidase EfeB
MDRLTRRRLLETLGAAGAGAAVTRLPLDAFAATAPRHQPGIATPAQAHLEFAAFDVTASGPTELRDLMRAWSADAARLSKKHRADRLTVTFGFGPGLFDAGRYGLERRKPAALNPLPAFFGDALDPAISGGDLAIQVCANDEGVVGAAIARLRARGAGAAAPRWSLHGFGRASSTRHSQRTPRNLMGFKDGTNNIAGDDRTAMRHSVWVGPRDNPAWLRGGSYLVARRIRMKLDDWNATPVSRQERIIGRHKKSGAPLGGKHEFDQVDFDAGVDRGDPVIPTDAHIRLSSPHANGGKMLLRRSYNYSDGLLFLAYQRNPRQFVAIQRRLGERDDALGDFIVHEGSALFACPPGARGGGFVGATLLVR